MYILYLTGKFYPTGYESNLLVNLNKKLRCYPTKSSNYPQLAFEKSSFSR